VSSAEWCHLAAQRHIDDCCNRKQSSAVVSQMSSDALTCVWEIGADEFAWLISGPDVATKRIGRCARMC